MQPNRKSASLSVLLYWPLDFNRIKTISLWLYFFENNCNYTLCLNLWPGAGALGFADVGLPAFGTHMVQLDFYNCCPV